MTHVKVTGIASEICWWRDNIGQISPVLDVYEPTGFIKIRVTMTDKSVVEENATYTVEGWIPPEYVEYVEVLSKEQKVDYITQHISLHKDTIMQYAEESMIDDLFNAFVDMKKSLQ